MTLADFLRQRLDEDEAAARKATPGPWFPDGMSVRGQPRPAAPSAGNVLVIRHTWPQEADHIMRHDPARVLREVEAGRAILARASEYSGSNIGEHLQWSQEQQGLLFALEHLAAVYADHPDYDESWRP